MRRLWLASSSPRRKLLLEEAGFQAVCIPCDLDDDTLPESGHGGLATCAARAWFKAGAVDQALQADWAAASNPDAGVLLAADTLCDLDGRLLGKAACPEEAEQMIRELAGRAHRTITGVALLERSTSDRSIWCDSANVLMGDLEEKQIREYIDSGEWRGKSGCYNFSDRVAAGWPLRCEGDPTTVMGLPMRRLIPKLQELLGEAVP